MIDIAYYMQFINAILSPCNRWYNVQIKKLKTKARVTKKLLIPVTHLNRGEQSKGDSCWDLETTSHTTRILEK